MKRFVKTCKVANFTKLFKQLIAKTEESSNFIQRRRKATTLDLSIPDVVKKWENAIRSESTPMMSYYKQYRLLRDREVQMEIAGKDTMEFQDKTPIMPTGQRRATETERQEFTDLFDNEGSDSDDSDDDDDEERFKPKNERKKKVKKRAEEDDDASSLNSEEYAMLDKDASDDDDEMSEQSEGDNESSVDEEGNDLDMLEGDDLVEDLQLSDMDD